MSLSTEELISSLAIEAMLHEVVVSPKPGLVDCFNNGSHKDMDIFTFMSSASTLQVYFTKMAYVGSSSSPLEMGELLRKIRPLGIEAERAMFIRTNGVNTHKGLIFSLGLLTCATAYLQSKKEQTNASSICKMASLMTQNLVKNELSHKNPNSTKGEILYSQSRIKGIRGEAEDGYPHVVNYSLPFLKKTKGDWNNRLLKTLLLLITKVEDTNILARHDQNMLISIQTLTKNAIDSLGQSSEIDMEVLKQLDLNFIENNVSPGGSADLLAVTIFLFKIENVLYS